MLITYALRTPRSCPDQRKVGIRLPTLYWSFWAVQVPVLVHLIQEWLRAYRYVWTAGSFLLNLIGSFAEVSFFNSLPECSSPIFVSDILSTFFRSLLLPVSARVTELDASGSHSCCPLHLLHAGVRAHFFVLYSITVKVSFVVHLGFVRTLSTTIAGCFSPVRANNFKQTLSLIVHAIILSCENALRVS